MVKNSKAVGYIRVSTDEQVHNGVSLEAQEERIRALAKAKGWELIEIVEDKGCSGKNLIRPGLTRLLETCKNRNTDIIIVYKVDRLTRRQKDLWYLLEDVFDPNGIGFISVVEPFDTTAAVGKAFLGMLGIFAQLERDLVSERTSEALSHKKKKGEWFGRQPVGFKINKQGKLEEDPETLEKIKRAKKLKRNGKSLREISMLLEIPKSTLHRLINVNLKSLKCQYGRRRAVPKRSVYGTARGNRK